MGLELNQQIPSWLSSYLKSDDLGRVEKAIASAEKTTAAEIVPMIVHKSISTGHVAPLIFLGVLLACVLGVQSFYTGADGPIPLWALEALSVIIAIAATLVLKNIDVVQRFLTRDTDEIASVFRRAQLEFHLSNIKQTKAQTGVLIFISLLEHRAVILADKAISAKIPDETWKELVSKLLGEIKKGDMAGGLCVAIEESARKLAPLFPGSQNDHNELPNHLVIRE